MGFCKKIELRYIAIFAIPEHDLEDQFYRLKLKLRIYSLICLDKNRNMHGHDGRWVKHQIFTQFPTVEI